VTLRELPADGGLIWRVTGQAGLRLVRVRPGDRPHRLAGDEEAMTLGISEVGQVLAGAPPDLRWRWRLAEARQPGWGWVVQRLGDADGWSLTITSPGGGREQYTWCRSGDRVSLVAACPAGEQEPAA
jgi:hypothetical protein